MTIFAVLGYEPIPAAKLHAFAAARNPAVPREWAEAYHELAPAAGIRTSIAFAQACHESGWFVFSGTADASWNNPAGLGVTGPAGVGNRFETRADGCAAHLGHVLVYFGLHHPVPRFCEADWQRHPKSLLGDGHKRLPNDIRQISGPGRWAPSPTYGLRIAQLALEVMA